MVYHKAVLTVFVGEFFHFGRFKFHNARIHGQYVKFIGGFLDSRTDGTLIQCRHDFEVRHTVIHDRHNTRLRKFSTAEMICLYQHIGNIRIIIKIVLCKCNAFALTIYFDSDFFTQGPHGFLHSVIRLCKRFSLEGNALYRDVIAEYNA